MKKITIFSIVMIALSIASCKKDRTCTCTTTVGGVADSPITTVYKKVTKKSAKAACINTDITPSGTPEEVTTCSLK